MTQNGLPHMTPELMRELADVAQRDADAILDSYAWPPRPPLSDDEMREYNRLRSVSRTIWHRSHQDEAFDE